MQGIHSAGRQLHTVQSWLYSAPRDSTSTLLIILAVISPPCTYADISRLFAFQACTLAMWSAGMRALPEVKHSAAEVADVLSVHSAEVAKVVLAHKVRCSLLHSLDFQVTVMQDVVFVLPPTRTEPAINFSFGDGLQHQRSYQAPAYKQGVVSA